MLMDRCIADVQAIQSTWQIPLIQPPFTALDIIVKTGCSFSKFAKPMDDRFQGHQPTSRSAGTLWFPACPLLASSLAEVDIKRS